MAELVGPRFTVLLENTGQKFESFISYSLHSGYTTSTDGFSFTLRTKDAAESNNLLLEPVSIYVNGILQTLGRIEKTTRGQDTTAVKFMGRDYISDLVECTVDPTVTVSKGMTIDQVILETASVVGISSVLLDTELAMRDFLTGKQIGNASGGSPKNFKALRLEDYKPNKSEGIFQYLNRIAARHGATLQPGNSREIIVVGAPNYSQLPAYSVIRKIDPAASHGNNIISATASRDYSKFPTFVLVKGKQGSGGARRTSMTSLLDIKDNAYPNEIERILTDKIATGRLKKGESPESGELYRFLYVNDDQARNGEQLESTARRLLSERLQSALVYEVTVPGHHDPKTGRVYAPDTIVRVDDDICQIHTNLWVESRRFSYSSSGATTTLTCWLPEAFQL